MHTFGLISEEHDAHWHFCYICNIVTMLMSMDNRSTNLPTLSAFRALFRIMFSIISDSPSRYLGLEE